MTDASGARRPYGSGSLFVRNGAWYGQWRVDGRLIKRKLGACRTPGAADGLTRREAEAELRQQMANVRTVATSSVMNVEELGTGFIDHAEVVVGRKRTTVQDYRSILRRHLGPAFGHRRIGAVTGADVARYVVVKRAAGLAPKTVANHLLLLHAMFEFARRRDLVLRNPVDRAERPVVRPSDDVRYLSREELKRLAAAYPEDPVGRQDGRLILVAAMTGLRQGELLALRWGDVDEGASLLRVRRSYTRGAFSTPKSRRGTRMVPLAPIVADLLKEQLRATSGGGEEDLVFAHPLTGRVLDASGLRKRFKAALQRASVRDVRFHDLRHTYGTQMAAAGTPLRLLQEWMGHRDYKTTSVYADYAPDASAAARYTQRAFGPGGTDTPKSKD